MAVVCPLGLICFTVTVVAEWNFYGFAAALRNISENDTQKKAEEGDKKHRC